MIWRSEKDHLIYDIMKLNYIYIHVLTSYLNIEHISYISYLVYLIYIYIYIDIKLDFIFGLKKHYNLEKNYDVDHGSWENWPENPPHCNVTTMAQFRHNAGSFFSLMSVVNNHKPVHLHHILMDVGNIYISG